MNKHTFIRLLTLSLLIVCFVACEKPANEQKPISINHSYFVIESSLPLFVGEELKLYVYEAAYRGYYQRVYPIKYLWSIEDSLGNLVSNDFNDKNGHIRWIPEKAGEYDVKLSLVYDNKTSKSISEIIPVSNDPRYQYSGDYHFMKVTDHWTENTGHNRDTTFYDGFVNPDDSDKNSVIIKIGEGNLGNSGWSEYFKAKLEYPEWSSSSHPMFYIANGGTSYFYGSFISTDSLVIQAHYGGHGGGTGWNYYGSKIK